jgi:hypothetical protein
MKFILAADPSLYSDLKPEDQKRLPKDFLNDLFGSEVPADNKSNDFKEI